MGTPEISAYVLEKLIEDGYKIKALITNPDKPVGRKGILTPPPTKVVAERHGIPVYQPVRLRKDHDWFASLGVDLLLTFAYGQIVPEDMLSIPPKGCLNLHGSLLPAYRGAAPMQRAIENGETVSGVTLMEMVKAMDAGRMYAKKEVPIEESDDYTSYSRKIAEAAYEVFAENIEAYLDGRLPGEAQDESKVTFADKISKEEEHLPLSLTRKRFVDKVRSLSQEPGGYLFLGKDKVKVLKAAPGEESDDELGTIKVAKHGIKVKVGDGYVRLLTLLPEGKKAMDGASYAAGHRLLDGQKAS